jgi:hypothetical protein
LENLDDGCGGGSGGAAADDDRHQVTNQLTNPMEQSPGETKSLN